MCPLGAVQLPPSVPRSAQQNVMICNLQVINTLRPNSACVCQWTWSLMQVIVCLHHLNQCWFNINLTLGIPGITFDNTVCKMTNFLFWPHYFRRLWTDFHKIFGIGRAWFCLHTGGFGFFCFFFYFFFFCFFFWGGATFSTKSVSISNIAGKRMNRNFLNFSAMSRPWMT